MINILIASFFNLFSHYSGGHSARMMILTAKHANRIPKKYHNFLYNYHMVILYFIDDLHEDISLEDMHDDLNIKFISNFEFLYMSYPMFYHIIKTKYHDDINFFIERVIDNKASAYLLSYEIIKKETEILKMLVQSKYTHTFYFEQKMKDLFDFYSI